ncbi:MAG: hypothetical protein D3924_10290 [Candidatus Electrothrix sp. AR4]|nr:hypothetical protein [Candidatus Electrothrix sp. AR4]
MDKNDVVTALQNATLTHKKWVANALALIEGDSIDKDKIPINSTECEFGKWYYDAGQNLKELPGFKEIEKTHNKLHQTYMEIFAILFEEANEPSFFSKLIGRSHQAIVANREEAMKKYHILREQSKLMLTQLEQLKKVITAMGDKQFAKYL